MRDSAGVLYIKKNQALKQNVVYEFKCDCAMQIIYRLHEPSPPSACRGTQTLTFRYWQAFLGKTQLKTVES